MRIDRSNWAIKGLAVLCCIVAGQTAVHAKRFNIKRYHQEKNNWCWAASSQMVLGHYGITKSQTEICKYVKGGIKDDGETPDNIVRGLKWAGLPATSTGTLSEQQIKSDCDKGRPFIFAWYWSAGGGHALVYDGYEGSQHYVIDPWKTNPTTAYSFSGLKNAGGKGTWKASMTCDKDKSLVDVEGEGEVEVVSEIVPAEDRNEAWVID